MRCCFYEVPETKYLGIAASMLINTVKEESNVLKTSHKWEMTVWTVYSSPAVLPLEKKPLHIGDFAAFSTPECFFLPNTNVQLHTDFFDHVSGKSSLIHTEATSSFSENTPERFTLRFCQDYFLKAADFLVSNYRCPGIAGTPLSFLKWKLRSSRAPQDVKPPWNVLGGPPCSPGPCWGENTH